jgi:hypothetical protein
VTTMPKHTSATHTKTGDPKIRHRKASGQFKAAPPKGSGPSIGKKPLKQAELDQDAGGGYNPDGSEIQE